MRFLVMPIGSAGDVHPFAGLAVELKRRGHDVTMATSGYFQELATKCGLKFIELGTREEFIAGVANPDLWHPIKGFRYIFETLLKDLIPRQFEIVEQLHSEGPLVVLTNVFGMGALSAQEKLGVKVVSVHLQPLLLWSDHQPPQMPNMFGPIWFRRWLFDFAQRKYIDPLVAPPLNAFRASKGLPPVPRVMDWWHSKSLILCLFPEWYATPQVDWPKPLVQVDFPLWDERLAQGETGAEEELPPGLKEFLESGSPPIAMTPGSANIFGKKFFEAGMKACKRLGRRGIFLTRFPEQLPIETSNDFLHVPFVPLSLLLPKCGAFIHHGGIGSASQALTAGIPQLVWPLAHDQFDNAKRLKRIGVADTLTPRWFTAGRVEKKLSYLLNSSEVRSNCDEIANKIERGNGLKQAADALTREGMLI